MLIKAAISIVGLLVPWIPVSHPVQPPEIGLPMPVITQVKPITSPSFPEIEPLVQVGPQSQSPVSSPAASYPTSGDADKAFIYDKESGNNPAAINPGGCRGLGQACPGTKLPCGDMDYACQDIYFTQYMLDSYGSWAAAKSFWLSQCPTVLGCWW